MFCKWCGLESDTTDNCSWCGKALSAASATRSTPVAPPAVTPLGTVEPTPVFVSPNPTATPPRNNPPPPVDLPPTRGRGPLNRFVPQGDGFDDLDDDLSQMPFAPVPPSRPISDRPAFVPAAPGQAVPPTASPRPVEPSPMPVLKQESIVKPPVAPTPVVAPELKIEPKPVEPAPVPIQAATPVAELPDVKKPALPGGLPPGGFSRPPGTGTPPPTFTPIAPQQGGGTPKPASTPPPSTGGGMEAIPLKGGGAIIPIANRQGNRPPLPVAPAPAMPVNRTPSSPPPTFTPVVPITPTTPPPAMGSPILARTPNQPGDVEQVPVVAPPPGEVDLGLKPLVIEEEEEYTPQIGGARRPETPVAAAPMGSSTPPPSHRHGPSAPVQVPARGGKTWYCKWCGMQSEASDNCSWCKRDIRAASNATTHSITSTKGPAKKGGPVRQPVNKTSTGPFKRGNPPPGPDLTKPQKSNGIKPATQSVAVKAGPAVAPQIGTFQAQKSKYYGDKVQDPISGAIYDADTGKAETKVDVDHIIVEEVNEFKAAGINLGLTILIAGVAFAMSSGMPGQYLPILGVASFIVGMIMPILRSVPFGSDDSGDIALAIGLILIFGPFVGAVGYGVVCALRQDFNPAIIGIFVSYLIVRVGVDLGTAKHLNAIWQVMPEVNADSIGARLMPLATVIGWYAADPFKKADE
ncbi:MAG: hypothetical protein ABJA67_11390 [Chthonomonadales bacterium]